MKKILTMLALLISLQGCAPVYTYNFTSATAFTPKKNELVFIAPNTSGVIATQTKPFVEDLLTQNNLKITNNIKKAKYVAVYGIGAKSWQTQRTVPVWGKTGINSINTTTYGNSNTNLYGNFNSYTNYGYRNSNTYGNFSGNANTSSYSNSHTTVNYDYGITGYHNVIDNHFLRMFSISLLEIKNKSVVYEASVTTDNICDETEFMEYVKYIYMQNPQMDNIRTSYNCFPNEGLVCERQPYYDSPNNSGENKAIMGALFGGLAGLAAASNNY